MALVHKASVKMKFALIKERKNPPDRRVVLSPHACVEVKKSKLLAYFSSIEQ